MIDLGRNERNFVNHLMGNDSVLSLVVRNWEKDFKVDIATGNGFILTEPATSKIKDKHVKNYGGSMSKRYGTGFEDEDAFVEQFSCQCGATQGTIYEGDVCPHCGQEVKYVGINVKMTGWIVLEDHYFIHPIYYGLLKSVLGKKEFPEIISYDMEIDLNGHIMRKEHPTNPYYGIGLTIFRENFVEIMTNFLYSKKRSAKKKREIRALLIAYHEGLLFQRHIPIYSALLRDSKLTEEEYQFTKIDKKINMLFSQASVLNGWKVPKKRNMPQEYTLSNLQRYLIEYWEIIISIISGKDGTIKDGIMGGRLNFSARDVIVPDPTLKVNEVRVGYTLFLEAFKFELICLLVKMKDISYNEAVEEWSQATTHFDSKMYQLMNYFLKKKKQYILLNRNPSIDIGSIMTMRIVSIDRGYTAAMVIRMPVHALAKLNADFDGDRLNLVSLKIEEHIKEFKKNLAPNRAMQISRITGEFDKDFGLIKDQILGLHVFNTI